jgi:hypothetical protein
MPLPVDLHAILVALNSSSDEFVSYSVLFMCRWNNNDRVRPVLSGDELIQHLCQELAIHQSKMTAQPSDRCASCFAKYLREGAFGTLYGSK